MVEAFNVIILGTVQSETVTVYREEAYQGDPCPLPYTIYRVAVDEVIYMSDQKLPSALEVAIQTGPEKESCPLDYPQSIPLKQERRYLLFLANFEAVGIPGYDGDRFELTDDDTIIPNGTEAFNLGPAELTGVTTDQVANTRNDVEREALAHVTVEEARAKILAAIAEAPLPAIPLWLQPYVSPTTSPEPTLSPTEPTVTPTATPAAPSLSPATDSQ